jgi:diguanylate cyclase (GGDEF)-like protein/PAS domain S-box-containing protein
VAETTSVSRRPAEPTAAEVHRAVDEFFLKAVTGVAVADLAGTVVQANPAFAALVGRTIADVMGRQWVDLLPVPADQAGVDEVHAAAHVVRPDGAQITAAVSVLTLRTPDDRPYSRLVQAQEQAPDEAGAVRRSDLLYRQLARSMPDAAILRFDRDLTVVGAEGLALGREGLAAGDIEGRPLHEVISAERYARVAPHLAAALRGVVRVFDSPGENDSTLYRSRTAPVREDDGAITGVLLVSEDVTASRQVENALRESEQRFRDLFEFAPMGIALMSTEPRVLAVNGAACTMLGRSRSELEAWQPGDYIVDEDAAIPRSIYDELVRGDGISRGELRLLKPDGDAVWVSVSAVRMDQTAGSMLVVYLQDVTARKVVESRLSHAALHDSLTDLPNRVLLLDRLRRAQLRAAVTGDRIAVLFCDLDNFKRINDSLGHDVGDDLLAEVAHRITGCLRLTDTAARLGGDEFVVLCESLHDVSNATSVAVRIQESLGRPIQVADHQIHLSASIGIALVDKLDRRPEEVLRVADAAMYRAKRNGRARYELVDDELEALAERQVRLEAELTHAIDNGELRVHYQLIVDANRVPRAVEALVRWQHPTRGLLGPTEFLDVAEAAGLVVPLGGWVLDQACRQGAQWLRRWPDRSLRTCVNISASQLGRPDFVATLRRVLDETGLPPEQLCLELTESHMLELTPSVRGELVALRSLGVLVAVDDFGTGYAPLTFLTRLPAQVLKVDRSFVSGIGTDLADTAIVDALLRLGRAVGCEVVAEGVETADQWERLLAMGCSRGQGFLHAVPAEAPTAESLLATAFD